MLVLDGNMKNRRDVCMARDAGYIEYRGLPGCIKTGCMNSPEQESRYCKLHQVRVCKSLTDYELDETAPSLTHGMVESWNQLLRRKQQERPTTTRYNIPRDLGLIYYYA